MKLNTFPVLTIFKFSSYIRRIHFWLKKTPFSLAKLNGQPVTLNIIHQTKIYEKSEKKISWKRKGPFCLIERRLIDTTYYSLELATLPLLLLNKKPYHWVLHLFAPQLLLLTLSVCRSCMFFFFNILLNRPISALDPPLRANVILFPFYNALILLERLSCFFWLSASVGVACSSSLRSKPPIGTFSWIDQFSLLLPHWGRTWSCCLLVML